MVEGGDGFKEFGEPERERRRGKKESGAAESQATGNRDGSREGDGMGWDLLQ